MYPVPASSQRHFFSLWSQNAIGTFLLSLEGAEMPDHKEMTQLKVILFSLRLHTQSSRSDELHTMYSTMLQPRRKHPKVSTLFPMAPEQCSLLLT